MGYFGGGDRCDKLRMMRGLTHTRGASCVSLERMRRMPCRMPVRCRLGLGVYPTPDGSQRLRTHPLLCPTHTTYQMRARSWVIS